MLPETSTKNENLIQFFIHRVHQHFRALKLIQFRLTEKNEHIHLDDTHKNQSIWHITLHTVA